MDTLLFPPPLQASIQAYKAAITLRVLLEKQTKQSISGKTVEHSEVFKQNKRENNFLRRQQKMVGNDSQIRNQISLTHMEKEGTITQKRGCFFISFPKMPINLLTKQFRCLHTY